MCKAFLMKNIGTSSSEKQNTTFPPRQKAKAEAGRFDFRFLAREGVDELLKHKARVLFFFFFCIPFPIPGTIPGTESGSDKLPHILS